VQVHLNPKAAEATRLQQTPHGLFVGKPVLESELMDALQRHLGLEWVTSVVSPVLLPASPAGEILKLPEEARAGLIRLVRLGHVHGLHRLLDRVTAEDPALAASCSRLRGYVSRCELELLLDHLTEGGYA